MNLCNKPALVEQLLFPMEQYEVLERSSDKESAKIANFKSAARPEWFSEGLDALWKFVTNSEALGKR